MRTVRVKWEGPLTVEDVLEMKLRHRDFGLYQIYGRHIIFGLNSLLYIGSTNKTFSQRLRDHINWLADEESVFIHVGRINKEDYEADRKQAIKDTEALTIYWHSPPYNSSNIDAYNGQSLRFVNIGKPGSLAVEFSSINYKILGDPKKDSLIAFTDMTTNRVHQIWKESEKACYLQCLAILSMNYADSFEETVLEKFASGRKRLYFSADPNDSEFSVQKPSVQIGRTSVYVNGDLNTHSMKSITTKIAKHFGWVVKLIVDEKLKISYWEGRVISRD